MWRRVGLWLVAGTCVILDVAQAEANSELAAVVCSDEPSVTERLAAREIRRYVYLRTGKLLPIVRDVESAPPGGLVLVTGALGSCLQQLGLADHPGLQAAWKQLAVADQYLLKTIEYRSRTMVVAGGEGVTAPLYAAYRFAEHLGVRFYLHGDVVPEVRMAATVPQLDELGKPLFDHRGIQPFHDFPEGPDWWDAEAYKAILAQLSKLRMNFFGLHTYPEGGVGPEPLVWIGPPAELEEDGTVKASYPSRHFTTANPTGAWGYGSLKTGDLKAAMAAAKKVDAPFTLATCGWVLGPPQDRALFDNFLPKECPMSCISRQVGQAPVEPGFSSVKGRPKWSIPWLEDNPALISPAALGGPDAQGRGRLTGLWLHRLVGDPLADVDPRTERRRAGGCGLGSVRLDRRFLRRLGPGALRPRSLPADRGDFHEP